MIFKFIKRRVFWSTIDNNAQQNNLFLKATLGTTKKQSGIFTTIL